MRVTINLDDEEVKILKKRAKKNLFSLTEQVQDIVRRSCVSYSGTGKSRFKADDKLIQIFSREKRGRKKKSKKKNKKK